MTSTIKTITEDPDSWPPEFPQVYLWSPDHSSRYIGTRCDYDEGPSLLFCGAAIPKTLIEKCHGWKWGVCSEIDKIFTAEMLMVDRELTDTLKQKWFEIIDRGRITDLTSMELVETLHKALLQDKG